MYVQFRISKCNAHSFYVNFSVSQTKKKRADVHYLWITIFFLIDFLDCALLANRDYLRHTFLVERSPAAAHNRRVSSGFVICQNEPISQKRKKGEERMGFSSGRELPAGAACCGREDKREGRALLCDNDDNNDTDNHKMVFEGLS